MEHQFLGYTVYPIEGREFKYIVGNEKEIFKIFNHPSLNVLFATKNNKICSIRGCLNFTDRNGKLEAVA